MTDDATIDEQDFMDLVSNEFYRLKALRSMEKVPLEELKLTFGCLSVLIGPILQRMMDRALQPEKAKRNYESLTDETNAILNNSAVRNALRSAFEELPKDEIVTEETFVRVFTETLRRDDLRRQFDISLDPILFALVAYSIFKMGIREFCRGDG